VIVDLFQSPKRNLKLQKARPKPSPLLYSPPTPADACCMDETKSLDCEQPR
jgi:hypothetical protein